MSVLFIGPEEEARIADAIAKAKDNATPWEALRGVAVGDETDHLNLNERKPGIEAVRRRYPAQRVTLGTYEAAISFEHQPAGLFKYLSVSSLRRGKVPGPEVMAMVCLAFGFDEKLCKAMGRPQATVFKPTRPARFWLEEFEPGWHAINVVELEP